MKYGILFFFLMGAPSWVWALELDEKLTIRFLKISRSKKTVLINRGLEDGLVVGDHAKFFLTSGVIARGVVVKASPTRSIWSIYRIVNKDKIIPDKVANIKIATPVKITDDPTKGFKDDPSGPSVEMAASSNQGEGAQLDPQERRELESLGDLDEYIRSGGGQGNESLELYGLVHLNVLNSQIDQGSEGSLEGEMAHMDWSMGIEKYFKMKASSLARLSLKLSLHWGEVKGLSASGLNASHSVLEYGVGGSWHFSHPLEHERLIGFLDLNTGIGEVTDRSGGLEEEDFKEWKGVSNFLSFGLGIKYATRWGGSARLLFSYYRRNESYIFEGEENQELSKISQGPRLQIGLGYRF